MPLDSAADGIIMPGLWNLPIQLYMDSEGSLPDISDPDALLEECVAVWNDIDYSSLAIEFIGNTNHNDGKELPNFVYYDTDGSYTEETIGDPNAILGAALPEYNETTSRYDHSTIILNGLLLTSDDIMLATCVHEFGHLVGLDHTAIYDASEPNYDYLPTMFPKNLDSSSQIILKPDDIALISSLYPSNQFTTNTGAISGTVTDRFGTGMFGIHVVAVDADTLIPVVGSHTSFPLYFSHACDNPVSGYGTYLIPGLPPGDYYVKIECAPWGGDSMLVADGGDSGVGIYDHTGFDTGCPSKFYSEIITVSAGTIEQNIDFTTSFGYKNSVGVAINGRDGNLIDAGIYIDDEKKISIPSSSLQYTNLYAEIEIPETLEKYLPSGSEPKEWKLKVTNHSSYSINYVDFYLNDNDAVYIPDAAVADDDKRISNNETFEVTISGNTTRTQTTHKGYGNFTFTPKCYSGNNGEVKDIQVVSSSGCSFGLDGSLDVMILFLFIFGIVGVQKWRQI